jgi:hypothetical protein
VGNTIRNARTLPCASLLLGGAASLFVAASAQAADLPVKAKPVQYVKLCSLYGDGFYYIPGSDTCLKIGGYVRADIGINAAGGRTTPFSGTLGAEDRTISGISTRYRANLAFDTRTESQYGTIRTLTSIHFQNQDQTESFNLSRAFIQFSGFTVGRYQSFSDTWSLDAAWHYATQANQSDTGANGVNGLAYTFDLGNGAVLNFGVDERRTKSLSNLSSGAALKVGADPVNALGGESYPDSFVNFRIDGSAGRWAATFLAHNVNATYNNASTAGVCAGPAVSTAASPITTCGHPSDKVGWTIMEGGELRLPFIHEGDRVGYFGHYGVGTSAYSGGGTLNSANLFDSSAKLAEGWITDGVFLNGTGIELTTTWTVGAGYEHYWTPSLKTSIFGAYTQILYDSTAKSYFASNVCAAGAAGQTGFNTVTNCDPNWAYFQGGTRIQWQIAPLFYTGLELAYTRVTSAFGGSTAVVGGGTSPVLGGRPAGVYTLGDVGAFSVLFRMQRSFNSRDTT